MSLASMLETGSTLTYRTVDLELLDRCTTEAICRFPNPVFAGDLASIAIYHDPISTFWFWSIFLNFGDLNYRIGPMEHRPHENRSDAIFDALMRFRSQILRHSSDALNYEIFTFMRENLE